MKFFLLITFIISSLYSSEIVEVGDKYKSSKNCKTCHKKIVDEWSNSWHLKSHFKNDEYFRKSIEYISRKSHKSLNSIKVQCATCHNPRISVTKTDIDYEIASVMGLNNGGKVDKALADDTISEGINCVVCHNIDKIHDDYDKSKRGINRVEWTKSGVMTGPYKDSFSPYHKTIQHNFMDKTPNKLCLVCHANDKSLNNLVFTNMEAEYKNTNKSCVECHMGKRNKDVASSYRLNSKLKQREVRSHIFAGAHIDSMWIDALDLDLVQHKNKLKIIIKNNQPHNIPSGFGAREIVIDIKYKKGNSILKKSFISLTTKYKRKRNKPTIPHLALSSSKDLSIPANGERKFSINVLKNATSVVVTLYYKLVNDEVSSILKLKDSIWSKKYYINSKELNLE